MHAVDTEAALSRCLRDLPHLYNYRYTEDAERHLRKTLCTSLILNHAPNLPLLFRSASPDDLAVSWSLRKAQGAQEGAEYTEAARGHPCGHIFKHGESSYHCKTCATDDTCVLCARCFAESDHEGHAVFVSVSPGNSGCCDCGDDEAWNRPVHCSIHKESPSGLKTEGKAAEPAGVSPEIAESIRRTIGKALDYMCDVFSCSPEQLRLPKNEVSVAADERVSRLSADKYGGSESVREPIEYSLVLWNDEKHTLDQVRDQVARACRRTKNFGMQKALQVDSVGRSVIEYSTDLPALIEMARILEQIKVSVTVRASRDTFREHMCETIIGWLSDISGCSVGSDSHIIRSTICSELFSIWQVGSPKANEAVGMAGIFDHEAGDQEFFTEQRVMQIVAANGRLTLVNAIDQTAMDDDDDEDDDENDDTNDDDGDDEREEERNRSTDIDMMDTAATPVAEDIDQPIRPRIPVLRINTDLMEMADDMMLFRDTRDLDVDMMEAGEEDPGENREATMAGYPPPPPPPLNSVRRSPDASRQGSAVESITGLDTEDVMTPQGQSSRDPREPLPPVPKTPRLKRVRNKGRANPYWLAKPNGYLEPRDAPSAENLTHRLRIDNLVLYDLRLWKTLRDSLRYLYIGTVITIPEYKRLLGLRFAGLYTLLAQLYLIADREPDHSIINLSLQLLTTPSITAEVIERANFLTHLMAILYTFLTSRQVGYPKDVHPQAALAFDAGAITNRRMFHFFVDARYIFQATCVKERLRIDSQYLLQFLDLVKLHQGICPNVRAVGDHVEYEADTWLSASMILKEINRLSRLVTDAFLSIDSEDAASRRHVATAIMILSYEAAFSSLGLEWGRFPQAEMKGPIQFRNVAVPDRPAIMIPDIKVLDASMSFHHPLHYILSWMLQAGKSMSREQIQTHFFTSSFDVSLLLAKHPDAISQNGPLSYSVKPHDWVSAIFDTPLRVCVWLAQMRAGVWVRNGMTLRHQMHNYRSPAQRDVTYQRDIFMMQAGLVLCDYASENVGEKFFLQIVWRFDMQGWLAGDFSTPTGFENSQYVDIVEDLFHLLVVLLSEREDLLPQTNLEKPSRRTVQRDVAHILCFKPLSYSELSNRLTERVNESEGFDEILAEMTNYKAPEGLSDSGLFELKPDFIGMIDPYFAFYNRNQREEADTIYREHFAKKLNIDKADVVPETALPHIPSGLFQRVTDFVRTESFARLMSGALQFAVEGYKAASAEVSRVEPILQIILHLTVLAVNEDFAAGVVEDGPLTGFIERIVTTKNGDGTILDGLKAVLNIGDFAACHPRARLIIKRAQEARPALFARHNVLDSDSRQVSTPSQSAVDKEAKKKAALERQAKVMAQFKAQQSSFMTTQGLDWDLEDLSDEDKEDIMHDACELPETEHVREFPADACILCQEDATEERLYGCFAFMSSSRIQRQTPGNDPAYLQEIIDTPSSLDRSAESIRPFGIASQNKETVTKTAGDGSLSSQEVQVLSRGFDNYDSVIKDHVISSCGHMMHFSCFETYMTATQRRHAHQISRNHPERMERKEFLCPLCKAIGNIFLPVVWKSRKEHYPGVLGGSTQSFDDWLVGDISELEARLQPVVTGLPDALRSPQSRTLIAREYIQTAFHNSLSTDVLKDPPPSPTGTNERFRAARALASVLGSRLPDMFGIGPASPTSPTDELVRAYQLLNSSVQANSQTMPSRDPNLSPASPIDPNPPMALAAVLQTVASTIASVEIHNRGVQSSGTLLTAIAEQTLASLRIFCETASSMLALEQLKDMRMAGVARTEEYYCLSHLLGLPDSDQHVRYPTPLRYNVFWAITACAFLVGDDWQKHGHNLIQLGLLAEVAKVVLVYSESLAALGAQIKMENEHEDTTFTDFCDQLRLMQHEVNQSSGISSHPPNKTTSTISVILRRIVERQALVYLRKVTILMHVRSAVDFSHASAALDPSLPELDRLITLLRLPPLPTIFSSFTSSSSSSEAQHRLVNRWLVNSIPDVQPRGPSTLDHPAIFELVGLPRTFDALTEEAVKRKCPTTGKAVNDPVVCLLCGAIFCSQASCCRSAGNIGGGGQHISKCGGSIGLFINIRKCMVLFLHDRHGSFAHAPYLDKHGEVDPTLRRHHQLFLNQRRYDKLLREVWLSHGVPSVISRKLEGEVNNGGWETL